jgi:hypothetical protein
MESNFCLRVAFVHMKLHTLLLIANIDAHLLCWISNFRIMGYEEYSESLELKLVYDRQSVGQSVFGTFDQFFFHLKIPFRHLRVCYFVAPSLMRGRVCNLRVQLLLGLARAVTLGLKSCRTHGHILLSHLRLSQPGEPGPRIYILQEQGGPVIPPGTGFLFCRLRLAGQRWRYSNPPPHGVRITVFLDFVHRPEF